MTVRPPLRIFASATLFAALCLAQPFALAQDGGNGKGTLTVEGEVTDSTCVVYFKDPTGTQAASSSTLKLTAVKLADLKAVPNAGGEYSATPDKFTIVSLGTSAAGTSCSLDGKTAWDFEINSLNTTTIGSKVLLSSVAADSGSSANSLMELGWAVRINAKSARQGQRGCKGAIIELQCHSIYLENQIMASNQLVQTRIDGAIKEEAAVVLAAMGLTVSDAVRMLLTRVAQDKALPFELMIPNATTIQAMKDARAGKVTKAANLTALFDDLNADT